MKRFVLILAIFGIAILGAQELSPFGNLRHSAADAEGNLHIRFDALTTEFTDYEIYFRSGASWLPGSFEPLQDGIYEALVPYQYGDNLEYRLRTQMAYGPEIMSYLHPAYLATDQFPPAAIDLALTGTDVSGDSLMIYAPALDLTDAMVASTETKLYRAMRNQSGTFPTFINLTTYNVYLSVIFNPEAIADSVAYAMVYTTNIMGLISSGLYKLGMGEGNIPSFERLGNIQSQVQNGTLYMACNWADLTSDPEFGAWPNLSKSLICVDMTMQISVDLGSMEPSFNLGDNGVTGVVEFRKLAYNVAQNTLPELEIVSYEPDIDRISLLYSDSDGDFPLEAIVAVSDGGGGFIYMDMIPIYNPDGTISFNELGNPHQMIFRCTDNLIDYVVADAWVSNNDQLIPAPGKLSCFIANPLSASSSDTRLRILGLEKAAVRVSLYNVRGQKLGTISEFIADGSDKELIWNIAGQFPNLCRGIYFLKVNNGSRSMSKKIIITR